MDTDLVAFGHDAALLIGMQQRRDGRHVKGRRHVVLFQHRQDARDADAGAIFAPRHAADGFAALAQLIGLMVAVKRERDRTARAVLPGGGPQRAACAHLIHKPAPMRLRPFPWLHIGSLVHVSLVCGLRSPMFN